ncbi:hypothetical protein B7L51_003755 [Pectobacterium brasiliense]|uniref:hypothetical protein n=1 Tax=Pectobacterium brasiliense TaxID=180957 RepID=UPI000B9626FA|nr:hypothetical protein [Pectobacterium carotovorum]OYN52635.1 hypothetical protein B7L51_03785 [Pectobacterium carotovorum]
MSGLVELAPPLTREQSIDTAKLYAQQIRRSPRLKNLAGCRIAAKKKGVPDWFIKMVDIEVSVIIHRIDCLESWHRTADSWAFASRVMQLIYQAHMMLKQYTQPHMMASRTTDHVDVWLDELVTEGYRQ